MGSVVAPGPVLKLAMTRSSSDSVKARRNPARTDGAMSGSVTLKNVRSGGAPRSIAASSSERSSVINRACTTTVTKHIVNVVCASMTVMNPRSSPIATKNSSSDRPVMTSGITIGA